jgi:hypothetical protein
MLQVSKVSFLGMKKLQLTLLLGLFVSVASFAQTDRNQPDQPKSNETFSQFESPESVDAEFKHDNGQKSNLNPVKEVKPSTNPSLKKDNSLMKQGGEKDGKKDEISTLSFNLFLYIVDRFKED